MDYKNFCDIFRERVEEPILDHGNRPGVKEAAIASFQELIDQDPVSACRRAMSGITLNGIASRTDFMHMAITPAALAHFDTAELNKAMPNVLREVCFEGKAEKAFAILDNMVAAGARVDAALFIGDPNNPERKKFLRDWSRRDFVGKRDAKALAEAKYQQAYRRDVETARQRTDKLLAGTNGRPPQLNENLDTVESVRDYVDRMVVADSIVYGKTIKRGIAPVAGASQWAKSVGNNPLAPPTHEAFKRS